MGPKSRQRFTILPKVSVSMRNLASMSVRVISFSIQFLLIYMPSSQYRIDLVTLQIKQIFTAFEFGICICPSKYHNMGSYKINTGISNKQQAMPIKNKRGKKSDDSSYKAPPKKGKLIKKADIEKIEKESPRSHSIDDETSQKNLTPQPDHMEAEEPREEEVEKLYKPQSKFQKLVQMKKNFEEQLTMRKKTLTDYETHKQQYMKLKQKLDQGQEEFQRNRNGIRANEKRIFQQQLGNYNTLFQNPYTFKKEGGFYKFYENLCTIPEMMENIAYRNPCSSFQLQKINKNIAANYLTGNLKKLLEKHFDQFPYITTEKQNIDVIWQLIGWEAAEIEKQGKDLKLMNLTSLFIRPTNLSSDIRWNVLKTAHQFLTDNNNHFSNLLVVLINANCKDNHDFLQIQENHQLQIIRFLIFKGLESLRYISYAVQKKELRAFTTQSNIYINTYHIETNFNKVQYSPQMLEAYFVLVLVREISNFVFENIQNCFVSNKKEIPQIIQAQYGRKDVGVKMERLLTDGKDIEAVSKNDLQIIKRMRPASYRELGQVSFLQNDYIHFEEFQYQEKMKLQNIIKKVEIERKVKQKALELQQPILKICEKSFEPMEDEGKNMKEEEKDSIDKLLIGRENIEQDNQPAVDQDA